MMAKLIAQGSRQSPSEVGLSESWSYVPDQLGMSDRHSEMSMSYHVDEPVLLSSRPLQDEEEDYHLAYYDRSMDDRFTKSLDLAHSSFLLIDPSNPEYDKANSWSPDEILKDKDTVSGVDKESDIREGNKGSSILTNGLFAISKDKDDKKNPVKSENQQTESKIKNTLMSAWNNMRHGWTVKLKTTFKFDDPIFFLGKMYHTTEKERQELQQQFSASGNHPQNSMEQFKRDFFSRIWFTYRRDFLAIKGTQLTSDMGWGCMIRSGQMMLAQALILHFLDRDWRWHNIQKHREIIFHRQILRYFGDQPNESSPFSIHNLVQIGADMGKNPGDWYGPASVAYVLRDAVEQAPQHNPLLSHLCLYVAQDCTVYKQDVIDLCTGTSAYCNSKKQAAASIDGSSVDNSSTGATAHSSEEHWRACILLIPVRLGGEELNPIYAPCVQAVLAHEMCLGIIGGKPKHSLYFVGFQGDKLIHLDPHFCQDVVDVQKRDFSVESFHCMFPRKMATSKMDPSCTVGFYCRTREDFSKFVKEVSELVSPPKEKGLYPMFVFSSGRSSDVLYEDERASNQYLRINRFGKGGQLKQPSKDSDDFVLL